MKKYCVIEGNAGDLQLVVFGEDDSAVYAHFGYEMNIDQLLEDIKALEAGDDPVEDWEGNIEDPAAFWDETQPFIERGECDCCMVDAPLVTRTWKVYGAYGHRQSESFNRSKDYCFASNDTLRFIKIENFDKTGTNEYSLVTITTISAEECAKVLDGQISDGIFEWSRVGFVAEVCL